MPQETLAGDLLAAQQGQAELSSDEEAIAARAVAAEWKQQQEELNRAKAEETPAVDLGLLRERLEEAHRHVTTVLATAVR